MRRVRIQCGDQRRPFLNEPNPRVAMTVDPPLVTLGQQKPAFQIEIVLDRFKLARADEKPCQEAEHQRHDVPANRFLCRLELIDQLHELLPALCATALFRVESRGDCGDYLDLFSDCLLLGSNVLQSAVDAAGQTAELLFREPPFFASMFRWSDSRTSPKADAIRSPGGSSGPP